MQEAHVHVHINVSQSTYVPSEVPYLYESVQGTANNTTVIKLETSHRPLMTI